jgi:hypothetical protein
MDLDLWISKVKEGQHLAEHELQTLCEYVSFLCALFLPLGFCSVTRSAARPSALRALQPC